MTVRHPRLAASLLALALLSSRPARAETPPLPDWAIPGPWQKGLAAPNIMRALQEAYPAFREPAPDHPVPVSEDRRWCRHVAAGEALQTACWAGALDETTCAQSSQVRSADSDWMDSIRGSRKFNEELRCRNDEDSRFR